MSYTQTPNYSLYKPNVNADDDLWGDHLNSNADTLDSIIHSIDTRPAGGVQSFNTRVGAITLQGTDVTTALGYTPYNVTNPAGYQTAGQVSAALGAYLPLTGGNLSGVLGVPNGTPTAPGVAIGTLDGTGVSRSGAAMVFSAQGTASLALFASGGQFYGPLNMLNAKVQTLGDATAAQDALNLRTADARYAPVNSPAFTGNPTAPTPAPGDNDTSIATTAFVAAALGGVPGGAVISDTAPTTLLPGGLWWDSVGGNLYVRYQDVDTTQYVAATNMTGLADAATKTDVAAAQHNAGRNLLHNGLFNVAQRGAGPWTITGSFTVDRFSIGIVNDTASFSQVAMTDADRTAIGDEAARFALQNVFTGSATGGSYHVASQRIEGQRRLAGKTVTLSFWAKCAAGTPKLGIQINQIFGTGGSPSAPTNAQVPAPSVTLSTTWTRYSVTIAIPTSVGKTFGTNGDDYNEVMFAYSAISAPGLGNIGQQSGTINLWGVQLEVGTQATPLDYGGSPQQVLAECQRFYQTGLIEMRGYSPGADYLVGTYPLPVAMRTTPTLAFGTPLTTVNIGGAIYLDRGYPYVLAFAVPTAAAGTASYANTFTASADL